MMESAWCLSILCLSCCVPVLRCLRPDDMIEDPDIPEIWINNETFNTFYPKTNITRFHVPETFKKWNVIFPTYKPPYILHPSVIGQPWADSENVSLIRHEFNEFNDDTRLDRRASLGETYEIDNKTGRPLNPTGRVGVSGRGLLGRWGPNYGVLTIVTRYVLDDLHEKVFSPAGKPLMEFIAVKFHGEWRIPGGFVEAGEFYFDKFYQELFDEALYSGNMTKNETAIAQKYMLSMLLEHGELIYLGYIKDNRNTDNAWIEGIVSSLHDSNNTIFKNYTLSPGDGAEDAKWMPVHDEMNVNPTHKEFLEIVSYNFDCHWSNNASGIIDAHWITDLYGGQKISKDLEEWDASLGH